MPLPARQLLDPACEIKPAWAVFDRDWYLARHAEARHACAGQPPDAALAYYLRSGAARGHSPSPLFDERFYLAQNVEVTELVRAGNYASGFDHFCRHGHRALSPHWLFNDALYASLYEDMTLENLDQHRCYGRYDHYLNPASASGGWRSFCSTARSTGCGRSRPGWRRRSWMATARMCIFCTG